MTVRVLNAVILLSTLGACVPSANVSCPEGTDEVLGSCVVSCFADDECLIDEVCDGVEHACVAGAGERPVITDLHASETTVPRGRPVHIFYAAEGAARVSISHDTLASTTRVVGDVWTQPITENTVLELVAFGPGGRTRREIALTVSDNPTAPTIIEFTMRPERPRPGELVTIAWNVAGARRVVIDSEQGQIHSTNELQGTVAYFPTARSRLVLIAENDAGQNRAELDFMVLVDGPSIETFESAVPAAAVGERVQLTWRTAGAVSMQILSDGSMLQYRSDDLAIIGNGSIMVTMPTPEPNASMVKFTLVVTDVGGTKAFHDIEVGVLSSGS